MLDCLFELSTNSPIAHAIGIIAFVCALGMAVGSIKIKGIGLGSSILAARYSLPSDSRILNFVKEIGLVVFMIGLPL